MSTNTIDLHVHSVCSDGTDTPQMLVENLHKSGITVFALTDHDTVDGCQAVKDALLPSMRFIPGVEFSCRESGFKCHLTGIGIDPAHPAITQAVANGNAMRKAKAEVRIQYLEQTHGIVFTEEELAYLHAQKSLGKPHFAHVLINRGLALTIDDAIQIYFKGCPKPTKQPSATEMAQAVTLAGGVPVWAHPLGGEGEEHLSEAVFEERLCVMLNAGIRGLECYYSRYNREEIDILLRAANRHGLLVSGGSDYHGAVKTIQAGTLSCDGLTVTEQDLTVLTAVSCQTV